MLDEFDEVMARDDKGYGPISYDLPILEEIQGGSEGLSNRF